MFVTDPSPSLTDLVRFLLARADEEDAAVARARRRARLANAGRADAIDTDEFDRRRAETTARRHVIAEAQHLLVLRDLPTEAPVRESARMILRAMAEPHVQHPSYRSQWRCAAGSSFSTV